MARDALSLATLLARIIAIETTLADSGIGTDEPGTLPSANFRLTSSYPTANATGVSCEPILQWKYVSVAGYTQGSYQVEIYLNSETTYDSTTVKYASGSTTGYLGCHYVTTALTANTVYKYRIKIQDAQGDLPTSWSDWVVFTTGSAPSGARIVAPRILYPNGHRGMSTAISISLSPYFIVKSDTDTWASTQYQISTSASTWDSTTIVGDYSYSGSGADQYNMNEVNSSLSSYVTYYVRARLIGAKDTSPWSAITTMMLGGSNTEDVTITPASFPDANVMGVMKVGQTQSDGWALTHCDIYGNEKSYATTDFDNHAAFQFVDTTIGSSAMVKIPVAYWWRGYINGRWTMLISDRAGTFAGKTFRVHGAVFKDSTTTLSQIYYSKYRGTQSGSTIISTSSTPNGSTSISWADWQTYCANNGTGWHMPTLQEHQEIALREVVEKATFQTHPESTRTTQSSCVYRGIQCWCKLAPLA